jgi:formylglycine-generating enzyme
MMRSTPDGMTWLPGGRFRMGSDDHYPEEAPAHDSIVNGFWIDRFPVTNRDFARFVAATGHVTRAEIAPTLLEYPDALPELLVAASAVFAPPAVPVSLEDWSIWWALVPGACWRHPLGPDSDIEALWEHPVVHIAYDDATAFASWAGKSLPTEAEWEYAAWGGASGCEYAWGDVLKPNGVKMANIFEGQFPHGGTKRNGSDRTSAVGQFHANGFGLYDFIGNVWEWTDDWYASRHASDTGKPCCTATDAHGSPGRKVLKGGSHLCSPDYCRRYRPAARLAQTVDTSTSHVGFRCVVRNA